MKSAFIFLICATAISLTATSSAEPSRQETIDWLSRKLSGYTITWTAVGCGLNQIYYYSIKGFAIEEGILSFREEMSSISFQGENTLKPYINRVSLSDLSTRYELKEKPRAACMTEDPTVYDLTFPRTKTNDNFRIRFTDRELAERVAKAFSRLIKLSGGEDEAY
jgi:hypothetical protein